MATDLHLPHHIQASANPDVTLNQYGDSYFELPAIKLMNSPGRWVRVEGKNLTLDHDFEPGPAKWCTPHLSV